MISLHIDNQSYSTKPEGMEIAKISKRITNNIYKTNNIKVNSRHKQIIKNTKLKVVGVSQDGYIEAIEDSSKKFFIGVQWHPESMVKYDKEQNSLFKYFIKQCK